MSSWRSFSCRKPIARRTKWSLWARPNSTTWTLASLSPGNHTHTHISMSIKYCILLWIIALTPETVCVILNHFLLHHTSCSFAISRWFLRSPYCSKRSFSSDECCVVRCKKYQVPIEKIYNKTQRDKFAWAIDMTDEDFQFWHHQHHHHQSDTNTPDIKISTCLINLFYLYLWCFVLNFSVVWNVKRIY